MKKGLIILLVSGAAGAGIYLLYKIWSKKNTPDAAATKISTTESGTTVNITVPDKPLTPAEIEEMKRQAKIVTSGRGH